MFSITDALNEYFSLQAEIHKYFGYEEQWRVFPIEDSRKYFWRLDGQEVVEFADTEEELRNQTDNYFSNEIWHHRHLDKAVYAGPECTAVVVDTHTDGNSFLQVFDNSKRRQ